MWLETLVWPTIWCYPQKFIIFWWFWGNMKDLFHPWQAFWNLPSFRKLLLHAPWHEHSAEGEESDGSCCYCALKSLFDEFACSEADTIPPDSLRQALSSVYDAKGRFKTGDMEDATETIEAILGIMHAMCNQWAYVKAHVISIHPQSLLKKPATRWCFCIITFGRSHQAYPLHLPILS